MLTIFLPKKTKWFCQIIKKNYTDRKRRRWKKGWSEKWLSIKRCWSVTCRSWRTRLCARGERSAGTLWRVKVGFHSKLLNRGGKKQLSGWKCTTIFNIRKPPIYNEFFFLPVIKGHNLLIIIVNAEVRVVIHEKEQKFDLIVTNNSQLCIPPFYPWWFVIIFLHTSFCLSTVDVVLSYCQDW